MIDEFAYWIIPNNSQVYHPRPLSNRDTSSAGRRQKQEKWCRSLMSPQYPQI